MALAHYYLGMLHYHQNDLPAAERCFSAVVEAGFIIGANYVVNSACGLALTYQAQGRPEQACELVEKTIRLQNPVA
ncbi:MAG: tetratricopeptide repeat protein [bacterium]|nr:tetratricopeptide repeat protein [bacterium]